MDNKQKHLDNLKCLGLGAKTMRTGYDQVRNGSFGEPESIRKASFLLRKYVGGLLVTLLVFLPACQTSEGNEDLLLGAFLIIYASNPCNFQARPQLSSVTPTVTNSRPNITGRVLQANGEPAIAALVIAEDTDADGGSDGPGKRFVSTFTGLDGDGSFYMAGLPNATDGYRISVEPIDSEYDGRIDTHIDCFQNPSSFSAGYYTGPSSEVNRNTGSASTFTLNPGDTFNAGDIILR